jgi:broad specificity phosphatase PhoE
MTRVAALAGVCLLLAIDAAAAPDPSIFSALERGGLVVVLRHAATDQRQTDRIPVDLRDCATQRNLTARGRADARAIGVGVRARRLRVGTVLASPFCRTRETARLAFGRATSSRTLLGWRVGAKEQIQRLVARFRRLVATRPAAGTLTVLVTHRDLISAGLGVQLGEGEAAIVLPRGGERFQIVTVLQPRDWRR